MADTIIASIVGALIVAILVYLLSRIDRLGEDMHTRFDRLTTELHAQGERLARIEGKLDEHLRAHPADST